jgi:hypothetical protein
MNIESNCMKCRKFIYVDIENVVEERFIAIIH